MSLRDCLADLSVAVKEGENVHYRLKLFCEELLDLAAFVPGSSDGDRVSFMKLTDEQVELSKRAKDYYLNWIDEILEMESIGADEEILLRSTAEEINSFILMERRGTDVDKELFKAFYQKELVGWIDIQQIAVGRIASRQEVKKGRRNRFWRGAPLTIGVEEELQIVNRTDWQLESDFDAVLAKLKSAGLDGDWVGAEVFQSQIETKTGICETISELAEELQKERDRVAGEAAPENAVLAAGTHPFSRWSDQLASEGERTKIFIHDMQDVVRSLVTFGLHVHIGVDDKEMAIRILRDSQRFFPILLGLSASSPFWEKNLTGLATYRSIVFGALPRTGLPPKFDSLVSYHDYLELMASSSSFDSMGSHDPTKIWWDARIHPNHDTIEFRICDSCSRVADTLCIAALYQGIVGTLVKLMNRGYRLKEYPREIVKENRWRVIRYGHRAPLVDPYLRHEVPFSYACKELFLFVEDVLEDLDSKEYAERMFDILESGTSASEQTRVYAETRDLTEVVQLLVRRFGE